jgi:OmpA-OmpF porin, OOP family
MRKIFFYIIFFNCILCKSDAQTNLVPNSSFEDSTQCPFNPGQISFSIPWITPTGSSSDYFNACNGGNVGVPNNAGGNQLARTGNAYAGIDAYGAGTNVREYLQDKLN